MQKKKTIVIVGGGFAGVSAAKHLARKSCTHNTRIILISDQENFEYHGALYRTATGKTLMEVCFPLRDIVSNVVEIIHERVTSIDRQTKSVHTDNGDVFYADKLILALGAQTAYFGIKGLKEHAYGMKTSADALKLRRHIHDTIAGCNNESKEQNMCGGTFVVVGGGATGVELAGDLAQYAQMLALRHGIEPTLMRVELIEAQKRILPGLDEKFATTIHDHLERLGVHIRTDTSITESDAESVYLPETKLKTKTVVWTAGVRAHALIEDAGFELGPSKRAIVCAHLKARDEQDIYIIGDSAHTQHAGMAQTAMNHGKYVANTIHQEYSGKSVKAHSEKRPIYAIPAGPGWAGASWRSFSLFGKMGWYVRRLVDLIVFVKILPLPRVLPAFFASHDINDTCPACKRMS